MVIISTRALEVIIQAVSPESIFGAAAARHIGKVHHLGHTEQTALVLLANLVSFGFFWVLKFMIFNKMFHVHTLEELDELVEAA